MNAGPDQSHAGTGGATPANEDAAPHNPGLAPAKPGSAGNAGSTHEPKTNEAGSSGGLPSDVEPDPSQQPG